MHRLKLGKKKKAKIIPTLHMNKHTIKSGACIHVVVAEFVNSFKYH